VKSNAVTTAEAEGQLPAPDAPAPTPRYLREFVRAQFSDSMLRRLHDIATGTATFSIPVAVPGMKDHPPHVEMVDAEAPAMVQTIAAKALIEVAIPKQMGLVDSEDKGTGVILMPAMEKPDAEDAEFEIVDVAPTPREETVNPLLTARILAKHRNGAKNGNGRH
jgi:hypothetical protein